MADASALFACTKCHSRHPFEELSQSEQLCKECRNNYPVVKCTYCRAEFQQGKGSTNTICKKCAQNVKSYGKPTACEYCNVIAAFIGNRCQRCTNSEKKYGAPTTCEQCKQKCAFDRSEESQKKVDGKVLCWLCTLAYRRVLAKTRNRQEESLKNYGSQRSSLGEAKGSNSKPITFDGGSSGGSNRENSDKNRNLEKGNENKIDGSVKPAGGDKTNLNNHKTSGKESNSGDKPHQHHHRHHHHHRHGSGDKHSHHSDRDKNKDHKSSAHKSKTHHSNNKSHDHSTSKKPKLDSTPTSTPTPTKSTTNGVTPSKSLSTSMASLSEKSIPDLNSTDHMIAITQLREELELLKKQLQAKEQYIKEREKKITELKAMEYETEKEVRAKITTLQKRHSDAIETLQLKNRDLQKQVASLSKGNKNKSIATGSPAP